ncbi:hypothetical protein HOM50_00670 [bacterium]|jgi:hypothetical protein|nr:hypothetical protein [bacterium]MBT5014904.1 hypothetical protein [bacterium]
MKRILFAFLLSTLAITSVQPWGDDNIEKEKYESWKLFKMAEMCLSISRDQSALVTKAPDGKVLNKVPMWEVLDCSDVMEALKQTFYAPDAPRKPFHVMNTSENK